jgi:catechol-2,3-dioxygenase
VDHVTDQIAVTLNVPNLGRAIGFYSGLLAVSPRAVERRAAWFDVPDSPLRLELREGSARAATRLRVCASPSRVRAASETLRQRGVRIVESGLMPGGHARALALSDPGGNHLELCAPLGRARGARTRSVDTGRWLRSSRHALLGLLTAGTLERRFDHARTQEQVMLLRHERRV